MFEIIIVSNGIATPLVYAWHSETFKNKMLKMYGLRTDNTIKRPGADVTTISS